MKISYKKLWVLLAEKEISKVDLRKELGLAPGTMTKLNHNEEVSMSILMRICGHLKCDIGDICEITQPYVRFMGHLLCYTHNEAEYV